MRTPADAQRLVLESLAVLPSEDVPLDAASARVLATDVTAERDYWPFARAAMDGIAVRAADLAGATPERPVRLLLDGAAYCGDAPSSGPSAGCAARIATGAPLPTGCDAVVPNECVQWDGDSVAVLRPVASAKHVFPAGEDARAGETVLRAGSRLSGAQIGLLAALGHVRVAVVRRPRVAIVACGDELVPAGTGLTPGKVHDSNTPALAAELRALGADVVRLGIAPDDPLRLEQLLRRARTADAVITCGGLSVGERDFARAALRNVGVTLVFAGVSMKPGHPASFGLWEGRPVFALPGTPSACRVAFEVLVRPAILTLLGDRHIHRPHALVRLARDLQLQAGRSRLLWARLSSDAYGAIVEPLVDQGSATIRSPSDAQALLLLGPTQSTLPAGTFVQTWVLDESYAGLLRRGPRAVVSVVGARNAGKTRLIELLIEACARHGVRIGVVKHHGHMLHLDEPGKDTDRALRAGAAGAVLTGARGLVCRAPRAGEPGIAEALACMPSADLVLVEGYASSGLPKLLVRRVGYATDRPEPAGPILAVVGEGPAPEGTPFFAWEAIDALAEHLIARIPDAPLRQLAGKA
ncbi:molybdopterin-guanine dinucleotide biosynthesis protein B [bacterium]|nr:MAG: molybdopterin-guanine dinucleotide biosynthesis protein B [bacterium]